MFIGGIGCEGADAKKRLQSEIEAETVAVQQAVAKGRKGPLTPLQDSGIPEGAAGHGTPTSTETDVRAGESPR